MADKKINEFNEGELVKILGLDSNGNSLKDVNNNMKVYQKII